MSAAPTTLAQIAEQLGLDYHGEGNTEIRGVAPLGHAGPGQLSFLANLSYRRFLTDTQAAAVVLSQEFLAECPVPALVSANPYADYARASSRFDQSRRFNPGIHPSAVVDPSAQLDPTAYVGPTAVIEAEANIGPGVHIGPGSVVGRQAHIGASCFLAARVSLYPGVTLGQRVIVHAGAVIGADGFGLAMDRDAWVKVPQLGSVVIGDDCEIGANTTIDRGTSEDTVLEADVRLDNQIQIAHNVRVGAHTAIAGCAAVAGSAKIGCYCLIGGGAGILGHLEIADRVTITAMTLVTRSIKQAGEYSSGTPLQSRRQWRRNAVRLRHLDEMARRLDQLSKGK